MSAMPGRLQCTVAVALVAALALACSPGPAGTGRAPAPPAAPEGAGSSGAAPLVKARSAYTTISASAAPWWMALEGGYFREQGLDVELGHVDAGATLLAALRNGELDVTFSGAPALVVGYLQGLETIIIGSTSFSLDNSIFVRPEIQRPEDLRGKTIGVTRLKAISDVAARLAFQRLGLQPDVDVFTRGVGGPAEALAAVETGVVDGASLSPPGLFEARKRGLRELLSFSELRIPFVNSGVGTTKRVLNERPELAERYLRALAQATSRLKTDREYAIQVVGKYSQMDDRELLGATVDYYRGQYTVDPYPDPQGIQAVLDVEEHPAARTTRPEEVVDYRFVERLRASGFLDTLPK